MTKKTTFRLSMVLGLLALLGCGGADADVGQDEGALSVGGDDEPRRAAVMPISNELSILRALEQSEGSPNVCVALIGFRPDERARAKKEITAEITSAANEWNALLAGNALWGLHGGIEPSFVFQESECTTTDLSGFAVNVWADADTFIEAFCTKLGIARESCSSAALPSRRAFYLGPVNRTVPQPPIVPFVVLHEYGHLLGLGDTYRISKVNDFVGEQPPSVMNGHSQTLTNDDRVGLWIAVRALKTGKRSCEGFGEEIKATANAFQSVMCDPSAAPVNGHGVPVVRPEAVVTTPAGPLSEGALRSIERYEVISELNCRSGPGTAQPIVVTLTPGTRLAAEPGTAGRPRIGVVGGKHWLLVKPSTSASTCYIFPGSQFVRPLP